MFNRKLLTSLITTAAVAASGYATNALAAFDTGASDAVILVPLSIAHTGTASLDFGTIAPDAGGATVQVTTGGVASVVAGAAVLSGTTSADEFTVTGEGGMSYSITLPGTITLTQTVPAGTATMTVNTVVSNLASPATLPAGPGSVTQTLNIGGNLVVGAGQTPATYAGTYTVTVNYQ